MNDKDVWEELSAYLDGEAADPEKIARLLEAHPEYARRFEELRRLSQRKSTNKQTIIGALAILRKNSGVT